MHREGEAQTLMVAAARVSQCNDVVALEMADNCPIHGGAHSASTSGSPKNTLSNADQIVNEEERIDTSTV